MSNLSLKGNNLTGVFNSQYRIRPESDSKLFAMYYDVIVGGKWVNIDCVANYLHSFETTAECIEDVVIRAEKKWSVQLTKTILKVA